MNWAANWIWDYGEEKPENYWLCFRKSFFIRDKFNRAYLRITADSRYTLYINGNLIDSGPPRSWPFEQIYDSYDNTAEYLSEGKNTVAVLVTHYGTSTSQYVQGRGGLLFQLSIFHENELIGLINTDETWKTHKHTGFSEKTVRINIAQPWVEIYDAGKFPDNWHKKEFDDSSWSSAKVIGRHNVSPWIALKKWDYKRYKTEEYTVKKIYSCNFIKQTGYNVTINMGRTLSETNFDNRDKRVLGYLLTNMISLIDTKGTIKLLEKKASKLSGRLWFNGEQYTFNAVNEVELHFKKGSNICLFDISGYFQTLDISYQFLLEEKLKFSIPFLKDDNDFAVIGPMEYGNIINIMAIDKPLNFKNPVYNKVRSNAAAGALERFLRNNRSLLRPVLNKYIIYDNPRFLAEYRKPVKKAGYKITEDETVVLFPEDSLNAELIVDFGVGISGFLYFEITAPKGVIIDIEFIESIHNGIIEYPMDINSAVRYIAKEGRQSYQVKNRKGFRYSILTFRNFNKTVKINSLKAVQRLYPVEPVKRFSSSDIELNDIWEISRRTLHLCMEDVYVDCPAYEQALWIGDARLEALFNYYVFGNYELTRRFNRLTVQSLKRSYLPECQVPTGNPAILTAWIFLWMISVKEYYLFTGDIKELQYLYPYILQVIDELKGKLKDDLLNIHAWNMFDWADMDTPIDGVITHLNALFVESLGAASYIASVNGDSEKEREFSLLAERIKRAVNNNLWDGKREAFFDSIHKNGKVSDVISLQTNIIVYLCGCAEGSRKKSVEKHLNNPPESFIKPGSPFSYFFYFEALAESGNYERIFKLIKEKWGEMLQYGATTCWETFKGWESNRLTRSHCHGWSAAPVYFIGAYILGVKPLKPGFKEFIVKPEPCGLTRASGYVPAPSGNIYVDWEIKKGRMHIDVRAPAELNYKIIYPPDT